MDKYQKYIIDRTDQCKKEIAQCLGLKFRNNNFDKYHIQIRVEQTLYDPVKQKIVNKWNDLGVNYKTKEEDDGSLYTTFQRGKYVVTLTNYGHSGNLENFELDNDNSFINQDVNISKFQLSELPGCCAYAVSHGAFITEPFRKRGLNTVLNNFRVDIAKYLGFSAIICTTTSNNIAQNKILEKNKWSKISETKNSRTGNNVIMWEKKLN